jgi:hypothetical protein
MNTTTFDNNAAYLGTWTKKKCLVLVVSMHCTTHRWWKKKHFLNRQVQSKAMSTNDTPYKILSIQSTNFLCPFQSSSTWLEIIHHSNALDNANSAFWNSVDCFSCGLFGQSKDHKWLVAYSARTRPTKPPVFISFPLTSLLPSFLQSPFPLFS